MPFAKVAKDATGFYRIGWWIVWALGRLIFRLKVEGVENMPTEGGCVVACNHTLGPDYIFLGFASPRQIHYMAKSEVFESNPIVARLLRSSGVFPVRRGQRDAGAIEAAVQKVRMGYAIGMFPEGTRSRTGTLLRGKSGVARIAIQSGAPVVPAVVINATQVLPNLGRFWRRPLVTVRFGKPLLPSGNEDSLADARQFTQEIMLAMAALLPEELRGEYANDKMRAVSKASVRSESPEGVPVEE